MTQPKRRRLPRFGLRSMFALVLVVAAYFGSWLWFKEHAQRDVEAAIAERCDAELIRWSDMQTAKTNSVLTFGVDILPRDRQSTELTFIPYVVRTDEPKISRNAVLQRQRGYYLWLFGWIVRMPITASAAPESPNLSDDGGPIASDRPPGGRPSTDRELMQFGHSP